MHLNNIFLEEFKWILQEILKDKKLELKKCELEIIDEDVVQESVFEADTVLTILEQLRDDLNFLTIYTKRPAYFFPFAEKMYEENGLIVRLLKKEELRKCNPHPDGNRIICDFETKGQIYEKLIQPGRYYIPIYKKSWQVAENLDIEVPIGYNTVIVKSRYIQKRKPKLDRFEEAFYKKDEGQSVSSCQRTNLTKKGRTKWRKKIF